MRVNIQIAVLVIGIVGLIALMTIQPHTETRRLNNCNGIVSGYTPEIMSKLKATDCSGKKGY